MKNLLFLFLISAFVFSCSKKEDPIERERKEMLEFFNNSATLVAYKGVKIALRVDYTNKTPQNNKIS